MSKIIFGPINSRRFGKSLGIDLSPNKKQCNFDCLYCELQGTKAVLKQNEIVDLNLVINELEKSLTVHNDIDVITLTANGEPTLYPYLQELVEYLRDKPQKKLILTNSATIDSGNIQKILSSLDIVKLSLDCVSAKCFKKLDRAYNGIEISEIVKGIVEFSKSFTNELIIEILFVKNINDNKDEIKLLNDVLKQINPNRIDIGTIDRPPAYNVEALSYEELFDLSKLFDANLPLNIASRKKIASKPQSYSEEEILTTLSKRPLTDDDIEILFDEKSNKRLEKLLNSKQVSRVLSTNLIFYKTQI